MSFLDGYMKIPRESPVEKHFPKIRLSSFVLHPATSQLTTRFKFPYSKCQEELLIE